MLPLSTGEGAHLTEASPTEEADRLKLGTRGASAADYHTAIYAQCHRVSSVSVCSVTEHSAVALWPATLPGTWSYYGGRCAEWPGL